MFTFALPRRFRTLLANLDPRRSLYAGAMWLIVALAMTFAISAAVWVGSIARRNVLEQHVRRLSLETDQLSSDLGQALTARLDAVRAATAMAKAAGERRDNLRTVFDELSADYPTLDWIAAADSAGIVVASTDTQRIGERVADTPWFLSGAQGPWLGVAYRSVHSTVQDTDIFASFGDLALPVGVPSAASTGVIITHVRWRRAAHHPERLTDEPDPRTTTEVCIVDKAGMVLVGPARWLGKRWSGVPVTGEQRSESRVAAMRGDEAPRFEQLPDGSRALVAVSALAAADEITTLGWRVQLIEPNARVFKRADALALQIFWVSVCLGIVTASLGIVGAQRLTRRLRQLASSVSRVGQHEASRITIPPGADEVAHLGKAFAELLDELAMERNELERRVAVRTLEVERLADESRYAAIVRERLKIARDLHDTLAHSMMATLSEIRLLRKLNVRDPSALTKELANAELIAHEGLQEARSAITQMRENAVRETGLGPALTEVFKRFLNLTGLTGDFRADATAARFGDERAETVLRMAREALRNVERHAKATHVIMRLEATGDSSLELRIEDNGVGFDPAAIQPGHYGLVGLREQAELIGAQLDIRSVPGSGTTVRVTMRLSPVEFKPLGGAT